MLFQNECFRFKLSDRSLLQQYMRYEHRYNSPIKTVLSFHDPGQPLIFFVENYFLNHYIHIEHTRKTKIISTRSSFVVFLQKLVGGRINILYLSCTSYARDHKGLIKKKALLRSRLSYTL